MRGKKEQHRGLEKKWRFFRILVKKARENCSVRKVGEYGNNNNKIDYEDNDDFQYSNQEK